LSLLMHFNIITSVIVKTFLSCLLFRLFSPQVRILICTARSQFHLAN